MSSLVRPESNLFDYFRDKVETARTVHPAPISPDTSLYLANLLTERTRNDRQAPDEETLAELHLRASQAPPGAKARTYRELGDRALYLLGYFREGLDRRRRLVGPKYYSEMGSAAYLQVDRVCKAWFSNAFGSVFEELSNEFEECVTLLAEVKQAHADDHPDDPLWVYEQWLSTGSDHWAQKLAASGLVLPRRHSADG